MSNKNRPNRTIAKTDGSGNEIVIDNPDYYTVDGYFHKVRKGNNAKRHKKRK
jgi:hypothetical protein